MNTITWFIVLFAAILINLIIIFITKTPKMFIIKSITWVILAFSGIYHLLANVEVSNSHIYMEHCF